MYYLLKKGRQKVNRTLNRQAKWVGSEAGQVQVPVRGHSLKLEEKTGPEFSYIVQGHIHYKWQMWYLKPDSLIAGPAL
jgi:hypothetical protein